MSSFATRTLKTFSIGGIHPPENKWSAGQKIVTLPIPKQVSIPVIQHIGAPSKVLVNKGDVVKVGQLLAESSGFVSANVHASVSGKVSKIESAFDSSGYKRISVIIDVQGDEWLENIDLTDNLISNITLESAEIVKKINEMGIVGLGGATFPTHVKLSIPENKKAEYLIINAVECEPYLTSDHQLMMEKSDQIIVGTRILMKALKVNKAIIGIENNKPDAIELFSQKLSGPSDIEVVALKVQYPQGGEKQLIKSVLNREVPSGKLPIDVGCVVQNVGTAFAVYEAIQKNKPLIERVVCVSGHDLKNPSNFMVRMGTPVETLIEATGGVPEGTNLIINGGPMMGKSISRLDVPVTKGTSGILMFKQTVSNHNQYQACIRCAKCVSVCPMGLEPYYLMSLAQKNRFDEMEGAFPTDCIECGSCSYTCPSHRPLLDFIRLGKSEVNQIIRQRNQR